MSLHITSSDTTTRSGLRMMPSEPFSLPIGRSLEKGLVFIPSEITPFPKKETLKTNTEMLQELITHPDGVRVNQTITVDPDYLKRQYIDVFKTFLLRAERQPSRANEFFQQGISYVRKRDPDLAKELEKTDKKFVKKRKQALEQEKSKITQGVSVKKMIEQRESGGETFKVKKEVDPLQKIKSLNKLTNKALDEMLKKRQVRGRSKMRKSEKINALQQAIKEEEKSE